MFPIYSELQNSSLPRITKVIRRSISLDLGIYLVIAVFGYISKGSLTDTIVLLRDPLPGHSIDYPIIICTFAFITVMIVCFPVCMYPLRMLYFMQIRGQKEFSNKENYIFVALILGVIDLIAILFPNVKSVISILGGLIAIQLSFFLPLVIWVKLSSKPWHARSNLLPILFFGWLCFMGYGSVIITLILMFTGDK